MVLKLPLLVLCALFIATIPLSCLTNQVTNLGFHDMCDTPLTPAAKYVCGLGLGFAPTPGFFATRIRTELSESVKRFQRGVLLHDYFSRDGNSPADSLSNENDRPDNFRIPNPS